MRVEEMSLEELTQERYRLCNEINKLKREFEKKEDKLEYVIKLINIELSFENDNEYHKYTDEENLTISQICKVFHDI